VALASVRSKLVRVLAGFMLAGFKGVAVAITSEFRF